jgi:hypothetical protein
MAAEDRPDVVEILWLAASRLPVEGSMRQPTTEDTLAVAIGVQIERRLGAVDSE